MRHYRLIKIIIHCMIVACIWSSFHYDCLASSKRNKDSYELIEENFSKSDEIDVKGLYTHLHYAFQNETLLRDALHPLLPPRLQSSELRYQHLEFIGDAVLGLIIRERILDLFPDQKRGLHNDLYSLLTRNKTLAEVYNDNLKIERYLPFPGKITCEYCNVIEALIGAIFNDNPKNGLNNSRKVVLRILDVHILEKKWQEVLEAEKNRRTGKEAEIEILLAEDVPISSRLKVILEDLAETQSLDADNPKSTLNKVLTQFCDDRPEYSSPLLGLDEHDCPVFIVSVIGAQFGQSITGFGYTVDGAEQNAAQNALNILAQRELITPKVLISQQQTYRKFINEYCLAKGLPFPFKKMILAQESSFFTAQLRVEHEIIEATGFSKKEAEEKASQKACGYLIETGKVDPKFLDASKQRRSVLREWLDQKKINDLQFHKATFSQPIYEFNVTVGGDIVIGKGSGSSKEQAREDAYRSVFNQLYEQQEKNIKNEQKIKALAKLTKQVRQLSTGKVKEPRSEKEGPSTSQPVAEKKVYKASPRNQASLAPSLPVPKNTSDLEVKSKKKSTSRSKKTYETNSTKPSPKKQSTHNPKATSQQKGSQNTKSSRSSTSSQRWTVKSNSPINFPPLIDEKPEAKGKEKIKE